MYYLISPEKKNYLIFNLRVKSALIARGLCMEQNSLVTEDCPKALLEIPLRNTVKISREKPKLSKGLEKPSNPAGAMLEHILLNRKHFSAR